MTQIKDGGPAFPEPVAIAPAGDVYPAYGGMTLRDWFAGQALVGLCAYGDDSNRWNAHFNPSETAYRIADAMLAAREERQP